MQIHQTASEAARGFKRAEAALIDALIAVERERVFVADSAVCGEQRWVDLHHIRPISMGGDDRPENLVTLCRAHHREIHRPSKNPSL